MTDLLPAPPVYDVPAPSGDGGAQYPALDPSEERRRRWVRNAVDAAVILLCVVFIIGPLHPSLLLSDTTPAGGDMGAHVWAPAYLRDELLPNLRLSGWTPDWYAGFPAYQFYMVIPSLLIVAVNSGLQGPLAIIPFAVSLAIGLPAILRSTGRLRVLGVTVSLIVAVLGIGVPYGVAFKWITVSGLLTLPLAAYVFGRLVRFAHPGPAVLAVATVPFLFDRGSSIPNGFTIYGGNIASTLAGEFAFSISLSLAVVYLGVLYRGLETGRYRAAAAVLLALTGLCHIIPAFFALAGTAVILLLRLVGGAIRNRFSSKPLAWIAVVGPVAGLLSAFWVLPFFWQRTYMNDMGWEKIAVRDPGQGMWEWFREDVVTYLAPSHIGWAVFLAAVGVVLSLVFQVRVGIVLTGVALVCAAAFVFLPEGRLWNARILPFYYLSIYLLAAVGVTEIARSFALIAAPENRAALPHRILGWVTAPVSFAAIAIVVGLPLAVLPLGTKSDSGEYKWMGISTTDSSFVPSWAKWNYEGYEEKDLYPEYEDLVATMAELGDTGGCGRAMWEYKPELDKYGTPMALMLLPFWTDGCIGSMEGLYFEASSTTPFHFLVQSELSTEPSNAQRDMPYRNFDIDAGVDHLQLLGVRYYMATSTQATTAASNHPDLTEVASSGPWIIYEVADAPLVEPLELQPAVSTGGDAQHEWLCVDKSAKSGAGVRATNPTCNGPALDWFQGDPDTQVPLVSSGPDDWQRIDFREEPDEVPIAPVEVTDVESGNESIRFSVDEPGTPVLVKASYFPNWTAKGAEGPYRVAPNLMVVVPTSNDVALTFGREPVDWLSYALTAAGLLILAGLVLKGDRWLAVRRYSQQSPEDLCA